MVLHEMLELLPILHDHFSMMNQPHLPYEYVLETMQDISLQVVQLVHEPTPYQQTQHSAVTDLQMNEILSLELLQLLTLEQHFIIDGIVDLHVILFYEAVLKPLQAQH